MKGRINDDLFDKFAVDLPLFGDIFRKMIFSRISGALSTLLSSGVPLPAALSVAQAVSGNRFFAVSVASVRDRILRGEKLSDSFKETGTFPDHFCELVALGEASGKLERIFGDLEGYYERGVEAKLKVLTSLIEPLATLVVGVAVLAIVFSIFLPLMGVMDALAN